MRVGGSERRECYVCRGSSRAHPLVSLLLPHRLTRRFSRGTVSRRVVQIYDVSIGKGSGANGSDGQVALRWQNDGGGYFGIVDREGTVRLEDNPICELCVLVIHSVIFQLSV